LQLGNGTTSDSPVPVEVPGVTNATAVQPGDAHTLIQRAGSVAGWGGNGVGQLGDGTWTDRPAVTTTGVFTGNVLDLAGGGDFACARITTRELYCWGLNSFNQTSLNGSDKRDPTATGILADQVTAGGLHACARNGGTVTCWGAGANGQLGHGMKPVNQRSPVTVTGLSGATHVSAGRKHTCAVSGGAVSCWGDNTQGQLGDNSTMERTTPVPVMNLTQVTSVSAGGADTTGNASHTCAIVSGGAVWCWGGGTSGQLGNAGNADSPLPVQVTLGGFSQVSAGGEMTCGLRNDGSVWCWGRGDRGRLGDGRGMSSNVPVRVSGF
jgi:alpha-tubulin suppressor-like RCC1 family protein